LELAKVKDYSLINQLYPNDDFIQSWIDYNEGDFAASARIARDAMEKLPTKPDKNDPRWRLVYPIHYYNEITASANSWGNDPVLIMSIIREESYFNPKAQSPVGARGLMQLMPSTAQEAANISGLSLPNAEWLTDSEINIKLGNVYYAKLKRMLGNKNTLAVMAYNGGAGSVSRWKNSIDTTDIDDFVEQIPYPETQNYLKKVYRSYWNYLRIYDGIRE
jgi:soluble lytic murein transglycosylase